VDKYDQLASKMEKALKIIDCIEPTSTATKLFLEEFRSYISEAKCLAINRTLPEAKGGLMGLLRWLSDFTNLENRDELLAAITDIEMFYKDNF
jgi:hypothetical protein